MEKNQKLGDRGITLIALIVTIIVLLILAGVSIAVLTGENGILNRATSAKQTNEEKQAEEELKLGVSALSIDYRKNTTNSQTFREFVTSESGMAKLKQAMGIAVDNQDLIVENAANGVLSYKGQKYQVDNFGGLVAYDPSAFDISKVKVGDYVNYNPMSNGTAGTTYTSYSVSNASPEKNNGRTSGCDSDQTFDAAKYVAAGFRWRVLDVKNGTIRLISETTFGSGDFSTTNHTGYGLMGRQGFINGENELKEICKIFGYGKGAVSSTSITAQDILDITGYDPSNPKYGENNWNAYESTVTYTRGDGSSFSSVSTEKDSNNNNLSWSGTKSSTFTYFNGTTFVPLTSGNTDITSTHYSHNFKNDSNFSVDEELVPSYDVLFTSGKEEEAVNKDGRRFDYWRFLSIWLATPSTETHDRYVDWGLFEVFEGAMFGRNLEYGGSVEYGETSGVRPVVTLESDVQLKWNETKTQWEIQ